MFKNKPETEGDGVVLEGIEKAFKGIALKKVLNKQMAPIRSKYGLKQIDLDILQYLTEVGETTSTDICRSLDRNKGQVSQSVLSLCARDLLQSEIRKEDRRYVYFRLTEKAHEIVGELQKLKGVILAELCEGLSDAEKTEFERIVQKICINVDRLYREAF